MAHQWVVELFDILTASRPRRRAATFLLQALLSSSDMPACRLNAPAVMRLVLLPDLRRVRSCFHRGCRWLYQGGGGGRLLRKGIHCHGQPEQPSDRNRDPYARQRMHNCANTPDPASTDNLKAASRAAGRRRPNRLFGWAGTTGHPCPCTRSLEFIASDRELAGSRNYRSAGGPAPRDSARSPCFRSIPCCVRSPFCLSPRDARTDAPAASATSLLAPLPRPVPAGRMADGSAPAPWTLVRRDRGPPED